MEPWLFTTIYVSPYSRYRKEVWEGLKEISNGLASLWCVGGDFNSILTLDDCANDSRLACNTPLFVNCLLECGLSDLGFVRQPFT